MTLVPAKQNPGTSFVLTNVSPTRVMKGRPIAIAATMIAAPRICRIATVLKSADAGTNGRSNTIDGLCGKKGIAGLENTDGHDDVGGRYRCSGG
jgi:hypothetical protein